MPRADLSLINELRLLNASFVRWRLFHPVACPAFCAHLPAHLKEIALYHHSIKVFGDGGKKCKSERREERLILPGWEMILN